MATTKVDPVPFGQVDPGASDNISHQSTTRPANAGHVYSADPKELEKRQGGVEGGTPMVRPVGNDSVEPIPLSEIKANAKQAEKDDAERVSTVGKPDSQPSSQSNAPLADKVKGGNAGEFTTVKTSRVPPGAEDQAPKNAVEATK